jgi:hypothetical protein
VSCGPMAGDPVLASSLPTPRARPHTEEIERLRTIDDWDAVEDGSLVAALDTQRMPAMVQMKSSSGSTGTELE